MDQRNTKWWRPKKGNYPLVIIIVSSLTPFISLELSVIRRQVTFLISKEIFFRFFILFSFCFFCLDGKTFSGELIFKNFVSDFVATEMDSVMSTPRRITIQKKKAKAKRRQSSMCISNAVDFINPTLIYDANNAEAIYPALSIIPEKGAIQKQLSASTISRYSFWRVFGHGEDNIDHDQNFFLFCF